MKSGIMLVLLGIVIIMAAVAFALYSSMQKRAPAEVACTLEAMTCPDGSVVGREGPNCEFAACPTPTVEEKKATFAWSFSDAGEDEETGVAQTNVVLTYNNEEYSFGTFEGSCTAIVDSGYELLEGEQDAAICWSSGVGSELGVFLEEEKLIVKRGVLEEPSSETEGFRGDFEMVFIFP